MIELLILLSVLGIGFWEFYQVKSENAALARDLVQINDLRVMFLDLTVFSGNHDEGVVTVTFREETVILEEPEILAYLTKPNSVRKHATLFKNGSASALLPEELEAKLEGHTVVKTLKTQPSEDPSPK